MRALTLLAFVLVAACTPEAVPSTEPARGDSTTSTTAAPAVVGPRTIETTLDVGSDGSTEPLAFTVPSGTRSIGVTAMGNSSDIVAVAELTLADEIDRVGISRIPEPLLESIASQHVRILPGEVFQEAGIGVHAFVYPNSPLVDEIPAGEAFLRLVSSGRSLDVTVSLPPVSEDLTLALDVIVVDPGLSLASDSAALGRAADLLDQAGITIRWDTVAAIEFEVPPISVEGVVGARGPVAQLVEAASGVGTDAVDVFVVPELAVSGLSPRIPGPATQSPLRAVVVKSTQRPSDLGRVIAHEVAHYLGLHHLELYTDDNRAIQDPIPDTTPGQNNLMSGGTILTEGQIDVLRRSPVLEPAS